MNYQENNVGTLDLIAGPMFSGKTSELLRRLFNEAAIGLKVLYINHADDTRSSGPFSTHNPLYKERLSEKSKVSFISISELSQLKNVSDWDVIGIDESQFFTDLYECVYRFVDVENKHVIVSGLNGSYQRKWFGHILELEPMSDSYTKLAAWCQECASHTPRRRIRAPFTHKIVEGDDIKEVGGSNKYIPVCRGCYHLLNIYS